MKIRDLTPNPENPRVITDKKKAMLKKALLKFGDISGIVFNRKTKKLVGGHQRREVLDPNDRVVIVKKYSKPTKTGTVAEGFVETKAGAFSYREVSWDEKTEKAANIAANKGAGEFDSDLLGKWMHDLNSFDADFDMELTMFDGDELGEFIETAETNLGPTGVDEDEVPSKPPAVSKVGDLYLLGRHRLMCEDSTSIEAVDKLMEGAKAEMLFTDPPYGVNYEGGHFHSGDVNIKRKREKIVADDSSAIYARVMPVIKEFVDGPCYTWFAFTQCRPTVEAIEAIGEMHALLIWHKTNATYAAMNAQYKQRHEPCIYWKPKGSTLRWCGPTDERTIWEMKRDGRNEFHPTQKPVELSERAILNHKAETVLDLFGGSGSTLIACEKTNRKCFMMEIDPHYCDVIVARWEQYTGLKAKRALTPKKQADGKAKA